MGDRDLLLQALATGELVSVHVTGCAWSCCGHGWTRRHEGEYVGRVIEVRDEGFMLVRDGIGTRTWSLAVAFVELVSADHAIAA